MKKGLSPFSWRSRNQNLDGDSWRSNGGSRRSPKSLLKVITDNSERQRSRERGNSFSPPRRKESDEQRRSGSPLNPGRVLTAWPPAATAARAWAPARRWPSATTTTWRRRGTCARARPTPPSARSAAATRRRADWARDDRRATRGGARDQVELHGNMERFECEPRGSGQRVGAHEGGRCCQCHVRAMEVRDWRVVPAVCGGGALCAVSVRGECARRRSRRSKIDGFNYASAKIIMPTTLDGLIAAALQPPLLRAPCPPWPRHSRSKS